MSASLDQIVVDLLVALRLGTVVSGSVTLNFDGDGRMSSVETKTRVQVRRVLDNRRPVPAQFDAQV